MPRAYACTTKANFCTRYDDEEEEEEEEEDDDDDNDDDDDDDDDYPQGHFRPYPKT